MQPTYEQRLKTAVLNFRDNCFPTDATTPTGQATIRRYTGDIAEALYLMQKDTVTP